MAARCWNDGRSNRCRGGVGVANFTTEVRHKRSQATVEAGPYSTEAPAARMAVEFDEHDGFLAREVLGDVEDGLAAVDADDQRARVRYRLAVMRGS